MSAAAPAREQQDTLTNIQCLRFVAALLVVLFHAGAYLPYGGHDRGALFDATALTGFGGVDIFFVISGFIMAWTTRQASGAGDAQRFLRRRVARIYSGYWPFCLIYVAAFYFTGPARLEGLDLPGSFSLWPTPVGELLISVSWTLVFEMYFYVLFALLIATLGRRREALLPALFCAFLAWTAYSVFVRDAYAPAAFEQMSKYEVYWASPYLLQFLAGALAAQWLDTRRAGPAWPYLVLGLLLWALAGYLNAAVFDGTLTRGDRVPWRVLVFGAPALALLIGLVRLEIAGVVIAPRWSILLGGASYALYLSHPVLLYLAQRLGGLNRSLAGSADLAAQGAYILLVVLIVLLSTAHYRAIERPLHRLFRRLLRTDPPRLDARR